MEIKVLGSSSSGNCYILEHGGNKLILDCGVKYTDIMRALDWKTDEVTACLVTHIHRDHSESAYELARHGVIVRSCAEVAEAVPGVITALNKVRVCCDGFDFIPFDVPHGDAECYGFYIVTHDDSVRLLYATDYEYIPYNFKSMRLTHLLIESNYADRDALKGMGKYEHVARGHAALDTALGVVEANMTDDLRSVILCHVSGTEDGESMRAQVQNLVGENVTVRVARKGEAYEE